MGRSKLTLLGTARDELGCITQNDYVLAGDFAMARKCIHPATQEAPGYLYTVLSAQTCARFVEGPEGAESTLYQKTDSEARRLFLRRHHTTLVAVMACALDLRARRPPLTPRN